MKTNGRSKWIYGSVLSISLIINCFFAYYDRQGIYNIVIRIFTNPNSTEEYWGENDSDSAFFKSILFKSMKMTEKEKFDSKKSGIQFDWSESYNLVGLSYYALYSGDNRTRNYVVSFADSLIVPNPYRLSYKIEDITQFPIGIFFINAYKLSKDKKYEIIVNSIYSSLISMQDSDGLIQFRFKGQDYCFVDALGMYIPFLMEYYTLTGNEEARRVAIRNIEIYREFGCDKDTGLPAHGYDKETGIKMGSQNWGRGIGWYLLALAFCPDYCDPILSKYVDILPYTQFPCVRGAHFDTSTALMFEIYKQSRNINRTPMLSSIKIRTTKGGLIDSCSGDTKGFNRYSEEFMKSEFCNGFMLMLVSKFLNDENRSCYILERK